MADLPQSQLLVKFSTIQFVFWYTIFGSPTRLRPENVGVLFLFIENQQWWQVRLNTLLTSPPFASTNRKCLASKCRPRWIQHGTLYSAERSSDGKNELDYVNYAVSEKEGFNTIWVGGEGQGGGQIGFWLRTSTTNSGIENYCSCWGLAISEIGNVA